MLCVCYVICVLVACFIDKLSSYVSFKGTNHTLYMDFGANDN
jgi:hypothetical protein